MLSSRKIRERLKNNDHDGACSRRSTTSTTPEDEPSGRQSQRGGRGGGHNQRHAQPTSGSGWSPILTILLVVAGVWVLFAIIRGFDGRGGRRWRLGAGHGLGGGGGGFFSNLVGGMFGAAAGMWMYNHFFGGGGSSAWGSGPG